MSNKTELQSNNADLQAILEQINTLPNATSLLEGVLKYTAQSLTAEEQAQARANIGAFGVNSNAASDPIRYVDHLYSDGTAYFDTMYYPNQNTRVIIDFQADTSSKHLFGARTDFLNKGFLVCWLSDFVYCVQVGNSNFNGGVFENSGRHTVEFTASEFKVDGATLATYSVDAFQCEYPLYIFSCSNSSADENITGKMHRVQVFEGDTPILDYKPCLDDDNVACAWDAVTQTYQYSAGAAFTAGEEVAQEVLNVLPIKDGGTGTNSVEGIKKTLGIQDVQKLTSLPSSGTTLAANAEYRVASAVGTYQFKFPSSGDVYVRFRTGSTFTISFASGTTYLGAAPEFEASTTYELMARDGVVAVAAVVSA